MRILFQIIGLTIFSISFIFWIFYAVKSLKSKGYKDYRNMFLGVLFVNIGSLIYQIATFAMVAQQIIKGR